MQVVTFGQSKLRKRVRDESSLRALRRCMQINSEDGTDRVRLFWQIQMGENWRHVEYAISTVQLACRCRCKTD
ncbi:hypothetical protein C484_01225 [Natrialba taiwanensis DSM 12281]|uniref:Uncharacterized protein n=1 Tax=Natrialba taiwanensis DSM 12281 TaxID=1230458 RepID=M0AG11_9EURY|nr:hypothetical protein C484_01225 [Natrialba taiwanensis DSM 12281]